MAKIITPKDVEEMGRGSRSVLLDVDDLMATAIEADKYRVLESEIKILKQAAAFMNGIAHEYI